MTAKKFSNALGNIGENYVDEAVTYTAKKKSNAWMKWGSLAACFALVFAVAVMSGNMDTIPPIDDPAMGMAMVNNYGPFIFMPVLLVCLMSLCISFAKREIKIKTMVIANAISLVTINILNVLGVYLCSQFGEINIISNLPVILISSNVGSVISIFTLTLLDRKIITWWIRLLLWLIVSVVAIILACMVHNILLTLFQGDMMTLFA